MLIVMFVRFTSIRSEKKLIMGWNAGREQGILQTEIFTGSITNCFIL